jgi:hypothetical protein
MTSQHVGQGFRWFLLYAIGTLLVMSALWWARSDAAVTAEWRVNLVKGTSTVSPPSTGATQEAAWAACQARIPKSAATTATYKCQTPVYVAIVSADPPPPPPTCAPPQPADLTQIGQCPTGTTGSWTQRKAFSCVGTTWTAAAEWTPLSAPAGACVADPLPPPAAPQDLTGVATQNQTNPANSNVRLTWTAVTGATAYEVERCTVTTSGCTFGWLADTAAASFSNNNLPPGITYRYRVRTWTPPPAGPYSAVFAITIPASTPPPPPPPLGTARLEWTKPPTNDDGTALTNLAGYRVLFGLGTAALSQQITVPNAAATQYEVTGLAPGTWYFAVRAYATSGVESVSSNVVSKAVP